MATFNLSQIRNQYNALTGKKIRMPYTALMSARADKAQAMQQQDLSTDLALKDLDLQRQGLAQTTDQFNKKLALDQAAADTASKQAETASTVSMLNTGGTLAYLGHKAGLYDLSKIAGYAKDSFMPKEALLSPTAPSGLPNIAPTETPLSSLAPVSTPNTAVAPVVTAGDSLPVTPPTPVSATNPPVKFGEVPEIPLTDSGSGSMTSSGMAPIYAGDGLAGASGATATYGVGAPGTGEGLYGATTGPAGSGSGLGGSLASIAGGIVGNIIGSNLGEKGPGGEMGGMMGAAVVGGPMAAVAAMAPRAIEAAVKIGEDIGQQVSNDLLPAIGSWASNLWENTGGAIFCFAAGTMMRMSDETEKPVETLELNDNCLLGGRVWGWGKVFADDIYDYHGVIVQGSHAAFEDGQWLRVLNSAHARKLDLKFPIVVYPIITERHLLVVGKTIFADLCETDLGMAATDEERLAALNADTQRNQFLEEARHAL